ncbi:sulfurtransferase complex subunit TusB [Halomonas halocynthiae]|uniref:sulfurtransferase complex subunit TusB n=1 Tax=Halomonas halocynthiae TaxID=176290 RepID=UPI000410A971|nr:sulfurtransferase complex subunit TusB [Halomonas halocynthiae]
MKLHILNRSLANCGVYRQALDAMGPDDLLLLTEDAVLGGMPEMISCLSEVAGRVFALREDIAARGLGGRLDPSVQVVGIEGFVELTEQSTQSVSWY